MIVVGLNREEFWYKILSCLKPGDRVKYWSVAGRVRGSYFIVKRVALEYITVEAESTRAEQTIPKRDFLAVYEKWEGYLKGHIKRYELRDITRFSSYIIGIIHKCLEED
ncbi:MAG: hypothetical protein DRJ49_07290 [Thermoprotei archaeon]|nr:MAG: hypothetical protein DRJ49_07290 [Thermoprotei archaeon]